MGRAQLAGGRVRRHHHRHRRSAACSGSSRGYYRGRVDTFIVGFLDILLSFPALVLALALVSVLKDRVSDLLTLVLALGVISIPVLARITRANTLVWSQREFVMAARAQGAKNRRIMIREVLPNVLPSALSIALLGVAVVIVAEAGLGTLGVGLSTQSPTWGNIINDGRGDLTSGTTPHIVFVGAAMVFLTVLALNFLGDVVRTRSSTYGRRRFESVDAASRRRRGPRRPAGGRARARAVDSRCGGRGQGGSPARGGEPLDVVPHARGHRARGRRGVVHAGSRGARSAWWGSRARARRCSRAR